MADLTRKTENLFDVLDYTDIQTSTNGGASNVVKTSSTISFKSNGENDYSGIYIPTTYYSAHINDYDVSTTYTLSTDVYTDVPCTIIFGGSATIVSIPAGTSRLSYKFSENITLAFYIRNTTANITLSKIMFAINDTTYEPYYPHSLRKLTTATEAVENPLYSDGTAITAYTIKGNTVQNGTPTPSNPIMPQGCGEKTAQLYNSADTIWILGILDDNGQNTGATTSHYTGNFTEVNANKSYAIGGTLGAGSNQYRIYFYDTEKRWISRTPPKVITENSFTTPVNCKYIRIQVVVAVESTTDWILNEGSTAKPYEPYGYKIPISSGGVTTNIYLGSTQSERQVYKMILTGNEAWQLGSGATPYPYIAKANMPNVYMPNSRLYCTHFQNNDNGMTIGSSYALLTNYTGIATDIPSWKQWLAAQYAAGTPVTVWYVLASETTAAVNEPLMKIDTYADTLSNATAIPTTKGANSITVGTTVQPSEFTATWTGWHDSTVKEWDGSQWQ